MKLYLNIVVCRMVMAAGGIVIRQAKKDVGLNRVIKVHVHSHHRATSSSLVGLK